MNSWVRIRNVVQAAPLLLVADALLTLLTVQVASIEVSKFLHEVPFFATIVLQQFSLQTVPHFNIDFQSYMQQVDKPIVAKRNTSSDDDYHV